MPQAAVASDASVGNHIGPADGRKAAVLNPKASGSPARTAIVLLALLGAILLAFASLPLGRVHADNPGPIIVQADGNYSGTLAPQPGQWYRYWYPGVGAVIRVTTTFGSSQPFNTDAL